MLFKCPVKGSTGQAFRRKGSLQWEPFHCRTFGEILQGQAIGACHHGRNLSESYKVQNILQGLTEPLRQARYVDRSQKSPGWGLRSTRWLSESRARCYAESSRRERYPSRGGFSSLLHCYVHWHTNQKSSNHLFCFAFHKQRWICNCKIHRALIYSHLSSFHVYLLTRFLGDDFCFWKPTPGDVDYQRLKPMTSSSGPTPQWRHDHQERQVRGTVPVKFRPPAFTRISRSEKASNKFCCPESLQSPFPIFSKREENITGYYYVCELT